MSENMIAVAPIALFVYNRLATTRQTVEALKKNDLAAQSDIFIFSDGGKDAKSWKKVNELRRYLHTIKGFKSVNIIERESNYYLERNVIEGVTRIINKYGKIIVLEDDVCVNPNFLDYMNKALTLYENHKEVMHISSIPHCQINTKVDAVFTSFMECTWGWATWANRWQSFKHFTSKDEALYGLSTEDMRKIDLNGRLKCWKSLDNNPINWDICWQIAIYKQNGLCLEPVKPMAENTGLYSGTHYNQWRIFGQDRYDRPAANFKVEKFPQELKFNPDLQYFLFNEFRGFGMEYNWLGKICRRIVLCGFFQKLKKSISS